MRKCIRCGCEMKENCAVKIEGAGYGIVLSSDENKLFGGRIGKPKVAICPECGEVSIYLEDLDRLNVSAKYCYVTHELRLHQNDRCKRFTPV